MNPRFTPEICVQILQHVLTVGPKKWTDLANRIPGGFSKDEVKELFRNIIDPRKNESSWSIYEERVLFIMNKNKDSRWTDIAIELPGRSDNAVKN